MEQDDSAPVTKRKKKSKTFSNIYYFQAEDEFLEKHAEFTFDYRPPKQQATDSRRAFSEFGIDPSRRVMFVPASKLSEIVKEVETAFSVL